MTTFDTGHPIADCPDDRTVILVLECGDEVPGYLAHTEAGRVYVRTCGKQRVRLSEMPVGWREIGSPDLPRAMSGSAA